MNILAIDLGSRNSVCGFSSGLKEPTVYETIPTSPETMSEIIKHYSPDMVVFEIGSEAGWLADICRELNIQFKAANTADERWKWKCVRAKNDKKDVDRLLHLAHTDEFPEVHIPEKEVRSLRKAIRSRREIVDMRSAVKNQIRGIFKKEGHEMPGGKTAWTKASIEALKLEAKPIAQCAIDEFWRGTLAFLLEQLEILNRQISEMDAKLDSVKVRKKERELLKTVPGIGNRTSEHFAAMIDKPERFKNARQVGCYFGLTQRTFQSGMMMKEGKISRMGDSQMRSLLVEAGWVAIRHSPSLREHYNRVCRGIKTRRKVAIVAVARKLACAMWAMLRDGCKWNEALMNLEAEKSELGGAL